MKTTYLSILLLLMASVAHGQTRSNTPLSRFGYGELEDRNYSLGDALNGAVTGLRNNEQLNLANPASLTALDSMTFIFELGLSSKAYKINENGNTAKAYNSGLDYVGFAFPIAKFWRTGGGLSAFSFTGYETEMIRYFGQDTMTSTIKGTGGLNQVYWSNGFVVVKGLSLGVNAYYIFGRSERSATAVLKNYDTASIIGNFYNLSLKSTELRTKGFVYSLGAQFQYDFDSKRSASIGATFTPAQQLTYREMKTAFTSGVVRDTIEEKDLKTDLPMSMAFGASFQHKNKYTVSADFETAQWTGLSIYGVDNHFNDYMRMSIGGEYLPDQYSMNFFKRIKYRGGFKYENMHWVAAGADGSSVGYSNVSVSAGFGLPFKQSRNSLNVAAEMGKHIAASSDAISDQYLLLKVNITLFDKWFHKRKID